MLKLLLISAVMTVGAVCCAQNLIPPDSAHEIIAQRCEQILKHLSKADIGALGAFIHPEKGLSFSPYGFIGKANRCFKADELASLPKSKQKFFWGFVNGSGKAMRRTFPEYFKRYVYDRDYLSSSLVAYNVVQRSDMFVNIFDVYPRAIVVDHLFLATPEFEEMDWRALRLVFTEFNGEWYLTHIVHDEWTL